MALKDTFAAVRPRETAGPRSADRFDYQRDWALCRLLELHEQSEPYLIVFDYHEDVVVLDSEEEPSRIRFFQVKTRNAGHWTINDLIHQKKGKDRRLPSHLAKLYSNKINFPDHTERLTFVSNAYVNLNLTNGVAAAGQRDISFEDISDDERKRISGAVKEQCSLTDEPLLIGVLRFNAASISLVDHVGHAKGKVTEFLERLVPGEKIHPGAVYAGLAGEIFRKNNCTENCSTLEEIAAKKGLSRKNVDSLLREMGVYDKEETNTWTRIEARLNSEQCPFSRVNALRNNWPVVFAKHTDPTNTLLRDAFRQIRELVEEFQPSDRLVDWLDEVVSAVAKNGQWPKIFGEEEIRVIALIVLYEEAQPHALELPPPSPGTKDQTV